MGCGQSKVNGSILNADDSVHRMIVHDQKARSKKGESATDIHYKPRQEHPLLAEEGTAATKTVDVLDDKESKEEVDELLYHTAHHNDTIDPRDQILAHEDDDRVVE
mmetsp:Transcript_19564/g.40537  ORF Transcript_19564/g.40537 Transcript_19564/m.40537 type:complete len:106 (-) Transcript_19564:1983-2300(-)